jgi:Ca-activated chloride channel family protein
VGGTIKVKTPSGTSQVKRVPPAPKTLAAMSAASGGRTFAVADVDHLKQVYGHLGSQLGHVQQTRPMTTFFAAAAFLVLLASGAMSLRWFGRLI